MVIEQVSHAKVLGVMFDNHITWSKHIDSICAIVNSRLALLRRIKPFLTNECALLFYNSCIHNHLIYCSAAWGNCSQTLLLRLLRLQKRAARILLEADFSVPSVNLFSKLCWLPVFTLIKLKKLLLLFNILINPSAPQCFKQKLIFLSSRKYGCRTRASEYDLKVPYPETNSGKRTFFYSSTTLFNALDDKLKEIASVVVVNLDGLVSKISSIKKKLRALFFSQLGTINHLEELSCYNCRFLLKCKCVIK